MYSKGLRNVHESQKQSIDDCYAYFIERMVKRMKRDLPSLPLLRENSVKRKDLVKAYVDGITLLKQDKNYLELTPDENILKKLARRPFSWLSEALI